eukprot:UN15198
MMQFQMFLRNHENVIGSLDRVFGECFWSPRKSQSPSSPRKSQAQTPKSRSLKASPNFDEERSSLKTNHSVT